MASDAKVSFSSKVEYRAVIWYLYLKGKTGQEIHCELTNVYGSSALSYAQVKFWVEEFKRSRTALEDETRSGRPSDATVEEMCNKVRDLVYSDRRIKVEEIANAVHISTTLQDRLGMHKLTARWVLKFLSDEQMATRASVYSALLKRFRSKEENFLSRLVTVDETWVHYYEPENKAQSRQSVGPVFPRPKKFKPQPSAGKVMATVFWDAQGVIMLNFLAKNSTITGAYSSDWRPGGHRFNPCRGRQHSFVEIDHEIFSTVILSFPLIQEGQLSVLGERMCTILVNRLED